MSWHILTYLISWEKCFYQLINFFIALWFHQIWCKSLKLSKGFVIATHDFGISISRSSRRNAHSSRRPDPLASPRTNSMLERQPTNFCSEPIPSAIRSRPWTLSRRLIIQDVTVSVCQSLPWTTRDNSVAPTQLPTAVTTVKLSRVARSPVVVPCRELSARRKYILQFPSPPAGIPRCHLRIT